MAGRNGGGGLFGVDVSELTDELRGRLGQIAEGIEAVRDAVIDSVGEKFTWAYASENTGAATDVQVAIPAPFPGSAVLVRQIATTGGVGGPCAIYFDKVSPINLCGFITNAQISAEAQEIFVPEGRTLIFHFYAQPNNQECTVGVQAKRFVENED